MLVADTRAEDAVADVKRYYSLADRVNAASEVEAWNHRKSKRLVCPLAELHVGGIDSCGVNLYDDVVGGWCRLSYCLDLEYIRTTVLVKLDGLHILLIHHSLLKLLVQISKEFI